MRGASRTGDKIFLRIGELSNPFVLFLFAIGALRTTHLPLAATPSGAIRAVFRLRPTVQKITELKESFSTPEISSPDFMWALGLPVLSSRATPDAAQVAVVERVCRVKSFEVASGGEH